MNNIKVKILMVVVVLCGSLGFGLIVYAVLVAVVFVIIGGCSVDSGSNDTVTIQVMLDDALFQFGVVIFFYDMVGKIGAFYNGVMFNFNVKDDVMLLLVCGVQKLVGGVLKYGWLYCIEKFLNVCGNVLWLQNNGVLLFMFIMFDKVCLVYLFDNFFVFFILGSNLFQMIEVLNKDKVVRGQRQRFVWCVFEYFAVNVDVLFYFALFEQLLKCSNWNVIDLMFNLNLQLSVFVVLVVVMIGNLVMFMVSTNILLLKIDIIGFDLVVLCVLQVGVSYVVGMFIVINVFVGVQVLLCVVKVMVGMGSLMVIIVGLSVSTFQFW